MSSKGKFQVSIKKEYLRRTRKLHETKLSSKEQKRGLFPLKDTLAYSSNGQKRNFDKLTKEQENTWRYT